MSKTRPYMVDEPWKGGGKRFGNRETGLIADKDSNAILTLVEKSTNGKTK